MRGLRGTQVPPAQALEKLVLRLERVAGSGAAPALPRASGDAAAEPGAEQLAAVLTKDINEALGNYAEDVLSGKTPRGIASSRNPFDLPRKAGKWEDEKEGGEPKADPVPKSLDRIIGSNGESTRMRVGGSGAAGV